MKVIIPLAGMGTRLRPHTYSKPKPMVNVAGKPVLAHILDELDGLDFDEIVFITGTMADQVESYMQKAYPQYKVSYVEQKERLGQAHAVILARELVHDDVLIIFSDTVFKADLAALKTLESDGVLYVAQVEDPSRFGVVALDEQGIITKLVEKPKTYVSNLAVTGIYYFKSSARLFGAIDTLIEKDIKTAGEYFLADAIELMIQDGAKLTASAMDVWEDCGTIEALLSTNRYLLGKNVGAASTHDYTNNDSIIIQPVHIGAGAKVERSIIGPNVSIADGATVTDSIVRDSIINDKASIEASTLTHTIVGTNAKVVGAFRQLNIGDNSLIDFGE